MSNNILIQAGYIILYQPVYNVFFLLYNLLPSGFSLGTSIVIFALLLRLLMLPLSLIQSLSKQQRLELNEALAQVQQKYADLPEEQKKFARRIIRENRTSIVASFILLLVQSLVIITLYFLFSQGLNEEGFQALYDSVPSPTDLNAIWLNRIDLTQPHQLLTAITCILAFIQRSLGVMTSPFPSQSDKIMQYSVPIIAFIIISQIPAGINVFLITTITFSLVVLVIREFSYWVTTHFLAIDGMLTDANENKELEKELENIRD